MTRWNVPDAIWESDNSYDIPVLNPHYQADAVDLPFVAWGSVSRKKRMSGTWHFYVDDYRYTALLNQPGTVVETQCVTAVECNFSILDQMVFPVALFRIYQKRWLARYWQSQGIKILVDLNVSPRYKDLNLIGVPFGWTAFATRGYTAKLGETIDEWKKACTIAGTDDILFVVYGGGHAVRKMCQRHRWVWIPERADQVRKQINNGKITR